ncbi:MAG: type pilus secretin family protein [Proteobacteria bacterium]|nr:type pilus secretin family protein [Pseudomonadota bacterium]
MKLAKQLIAAAAIGCLSLAGVHAAPSDSAKNTIQAINVAPQGGDVLVKIDFKEALTAPPAGFAISKPPRIALDFPATSSGLNRSSQTFNQGDLTSVSVVQAGDRTRMVFNLIRSLNYETRIDGNSLLMTLKAAAGSAATAKTTSRFAEETLIGRKHSVTDISFRRGKDGEARILVDLSDPGTGIDIRQQGTALIVDFMKTTVPENLKRRLDVTDFATPVTTVSTASNGDNARMTITPKGLWEHTAYQTDNQFVIEVKPVIEDPNKLVQGSKLGYQGPRVSINYQNGDVRALLRLMAEELGLNAVISETVTGTTTLVLKDVPADQVIAIIFQQKGLDMRKNGNVILIAPRDELALREKQEAEAKNDLHKLEPLVMEPIQLNYQKAVDVAKLLTSSGGSGGDKGGAGLRMLSARGSATPDIATNQLFINDVPSKIDEIRKFIKLIDIATRQVLIEARVVEATEDFGKDLGVRFGLFNNGSVQLNGGRSGYFLGGNRAENMGSPTITQGGSTVNQVAAVNLPVTNPAGSLTFSLFNNALTKILNVELTALESDGKGKIISSPKVMTANNVKALIEDGYEVPYLQTSDNTVTVTWKKVMLKLETTPQITPDGKVKMLLKISKDEPIWERQLLGGYPIKSVNIETEAVVENGGTVVIGGVFRTSNALGTDRIPFFGDLPYVGFLFKNTTNRMEKKEILIFITPRILNEQMTLN